MSQHSSLLVLQVRNYFVYLRSQWVQSLYEALKVNRLEFRLMESLHSTAATETKIRFRYRYRSLNFFYLNRNFLHFLFLKFFSCFLCLVLNISHVIQSYHVKCFSTICLIFIGLFVLVNYLHKMFW